MQRTEESRSSELIMRHLLERRLCGTHCGPAGGETNVGSGSGDNERGEIVFSKLLR